MPYKNLEDLRAYRKRYWALNKKKQTVQNEHWKQKNRVRVRELNLRSLKKKRAEDPNRFRSYSIQRQYRISGPEYDARLAEQQGLCDLCHLPFGRAMNERPVLDHNHKTQSLRKFIHRACNIGIGAFKDDSRLCLLAADYLKRHDDA
jgi:hypothetical protein